MFVRPLVVASLFVSCLLQSFAAPVPRQVTDYPAAHAVQGELPGALAVDSHGYTYLAGTLTASAGGHAAGAIYVTRIDPSGENRLYTAYLDASGVQRVTGAAVDEAGNLYITGYTSSTDFPVIGGVQGAHGGGLDTFVAKLDSKGRSWLYSTYLGGTGDDVAKGMAVDQQGNAYITGWTASANFPLKNAAQTQRSGERSGFLAEISSDGATLLYATYLGSGVRSSGNGIAVDSEGAVYVAGSVAAEGGNKQAFLLKTATHASNPEYFRIVDGDGEQEATSIALDRKGAVYLTGSTEGNGRAVFAAKFTTGGERLYSTTIVGTEGETEPTIAADLLGNAYIASGRAGLLVKLSADGYRQLVSEALPATGARGIGLAVAGSGRAIAAGASAAGQAYAARVSTCNLWLSQSTQMVAAEGATASVAVQTTPECDWQAAAGAPWVDVSGSTAGNGTLSYRVAPNRGPARAATIAVGGETVLVRQAAGSSSSPSPIRDNPGFRARSLTGCDDCSSPQIVDLGFSIDFYGRAYTQVWVNANGNITFDAPTGRYTPEPLATLKSAMIAPFWADADTRRAAPGAIGYGHDTVDGHAAFGVTWTGVGHYAGNRDTSNSFQLVLIDRGDAGPGLFDIEMNYAGLEWDAGEASGRVSARAGFTNGTGQPGTWLELPGSGEPGAFLDNGKDSLAGRHTLNVRPAGALTPVSSTTAAPSTVSVAHVAAIPAIGKPLPRAAVGTITEYPVPISGTEPFGITAGPDGALWFTDWSGYIGRITTIGLVTEVSDSSTNQQGIVTGPDGNLWFADSIANKIGRITPDGAITLFATPTTTSGPANIIVGPDGNMWFTEFNASKIGTITTAGQITEFALAEGEPEGIAVGPDNALWFTEFQGGINKIGRITTTGTISGFTIPTGVSEPEGIAAGTDGNLWFTEYNGNKIGRLTPGGEFTEYLLPTPSSNPYAILSGPDGALWFTEKGSDQIGRITTTGTLTEYAVPTANSQPSDIAVGADGAIWFTEFNRGKIGRITTGITNPPVLSIAKSHAGNFNPSQQGATYTVTVSNAAGAGTTSGTVTVTEMVPAGLTLVSMAGAGWTCANGGTTCTCGTPLSGGSNYPSITVTVNVAYAAATPQVNAVFVSGGGSASASITDSTVINSAFSVGTITEYPVPISGTEPFGITAGPDNALWFTDWSGYIGRMTTVGAVTEVPDPSTNQQGIVTGPDGNLWFANSIANKIGRITPDGVLTEYATPTTTSGPANIIVGPDSALWFTEFNANKIGRITTSGVITEFALGEGEPEGITVGPDGALWFTEFQGGIDQIGRITTTGAITVFAIPTNVAEPWGIATGPDGNLWFTEYNGNRIGRLTPGGVFTEYPLPTPSSNPYAILSGPDGALWFTERGSDQIGRMTTGGFLTEYAVPTSNSQPSDITVGPDGALWFTEFNRGKIGRIIGGITDPPVLSIAKSHTGNFTPGQQGATYTVTVSNAAAARATAGTVTVTEMAPAGLTLVSMSGLGWTCPDNTNTCTRGDSLSGGSSYSSITVTVNVAANAATPQVNEVFVSGGGSASASITDSTVIDSAVSLGSITEYPVSISGSEPYGITAGPDGALWFTDWAKAIGRITTTGVVTKTSDGSTNQQGIVTGPDGNLWFADSVADKIGRITPDGVITEFATPTTTSGPANLIVGPDQNLWFTEFNASKIGKVTTAGVIAEFALSEGEPEGITVGSDGALWFTEFQGGIDQIGRITTAGAITVFAIPTNVSEPEGIAAGSDGALWFTEYNGNKIARITTEGVFTEYPLPTPASRPNGIVAGPDGALWFAESASNQIGRITTAGLIAEYPVPTANSQPTDITVGPDGAIWFTEFNRAKIGRIATDGTLGPALSIAKTHVGNFSPGQQGATYTVTVSNAPGAATTSGMVTVTETMPPGMTLVSMAGPGWNCPGGTTCTRSDGLAPGVSYPLVVTVNVTASQAAEVVNRVSVSGGGSNPATASDRTVIGPFSPCDFNQVGITTVVDVQLIINEALGVIAAAHDIDADDVVSIIDVQIVIGGVIGLGCLVPGL